VPTCTRCEGAPALSTPLLLGATALCSQEEVNFCSRCGSCHTRKLLTTALSDWMCMQVLQVKDPLGLTHTHVGVRIIEWRGPPLHPSLDLKSRTTYMKPKYQHKPAQRARIRVTFIPEVVRAWRCARAWPQQDTLRTIRARSALFAFASASHSSSESCVHASGNCGFALIDTVVWDPVLVRSTYIQPAQSTLSICDL
jgi:hypothetical protein